MNKISVSTRCTREEYIAFCVWRHKKSVLTTIVGTVLLLMTVVIYALLPSLSQLGALCLLLGILGVLAEPVILPMIRKGDAARRYDASDSLQQAISLTVDGETLTVRTACQEGILPLSAMTQVQQTADMIALVFGKELTLCIPKRALDDGEWQTLVDSIKG